MQKTLNVARGKDEDYEIMINVWATGSLQIGEIRLMLAGRTI